MTKLEDYFARAKEQLRRLRTFAQSDKQVRSYEKLSQKLQTEIDTYFRTKQKYEMLANEKNAGKAVGSFLGSFANSDRDSDVAVMKVYDQADFVNKREDHIVKLNK